ncbi:K(+)-transporting ATPase subunit F [Methylomonas paludis]|uniref:K(+)-transporting ATPase subunit F n=1 Tax=Methylomonas paludis TaxID=1173101 RepID=A0A975MMF9_9GAMM|nr:K(+)-transporting ATPase subunit F [Methylomonas paludis]
MTAEYTISLLVVMCLVVYLIVALINPEDFT